MLRGASGHDADHRDDHAGGARRVFLNFTLSAAGLGRELRAFMDGLGLSP
jgi:hypothetical protein